MRSRGQSHAAFVMTPGLERVLDEFPDAIIVTTTDGKVLFWSRGAELLFGHASAEVLGLDLPELLVPADRLGEQHRILQEALAGETRVYEALRRTKSGACVYVDITSKAVWNDRGEIDYVLSVKKDVTARKVLRDAKLVEGRFGDLLEAMPDAIVMVNSGGRIVACNRRAEKLFGYEPLELRGQPVEVLVPEHYRRDHVERRSHYSQRPRNRPMGVGLELVGLRRDGSEFPVEISLSPVDTDEGTLVTSAIRDITERQRYRTAQESHAATEPARAAAGAVHARDEARNRLETILGIADTLLMKVPGPLTGQQETDLETLRSSSRQLLGLLGPLLEPRRSKPRPRREL